MSALGEPATIVQVSGDDVLVAIPLVGFPKGFKVQPGQRVMVMADDSGLAARPIVATIDVEGSCEDLAKAKTIDINGEPYEFQPATAHADPNSKKSATLFVVAHGSASGPKQIVGSRPRGSMRG